MLQILKTTKDFVGKDIYAATVLVLHGMDKNPDDKNYPDAHRGYIDIFDKDGVFVGRIWDPAWIPGRSTIK